MTVTTPPPPLTDELDALLRRLRMPYIRKAAPELLATAKSQRWDPAELLRVLLAEEAEAATARRSRSDDAPPGCRPARRSTPGIRSLPDPEGHPAGVAVPGMGAPRRERLHLRTVGTGKSHLAEAFGHLAIDHGKTVAWHTLESLALLLRRHRADDSVSKAIGRLIRADLIVIDDIAMLPVTSDAAEALFRIVDAAYEKRSIALTSNIHPAGFDELMPKTLATATVDRLLHHAHVLITDGADSYRLAQATAGKGVRPLA